MRLKMIVKVHTKLEDCTTFCSNIKNGKKRLSIPQKLYRKTVNLAQKSHH